jgi:hypothetical protein
VAAGPCDSASLKGAHVSHRAERLWDRDDGQHLRRKRRRGNGVLPRQRRLSGIPAVMPQPHLVPRIRAVIKDADVPRGSILLCPVHVHSPVESPWLSEPCCLWLATDSADIADIAARWTGGRSAQVFGATCPEGARPPCGALNTREGRQSGHGSSRRRCETVDCLRSSVWHRCDHVARPPHQRADHHAK